MFGSYQKSLEIIARLKAQACKSGDYMMDFPTLNIMEDLITQALIKEQQEHADTYQDEIIAGVMLEMKEKGKKFISRKGRILQFEGSDGTQVIYAL